MSERPARVRGVKKHQCRGSYEPRLIFIERNNINLKRIGCIVGLIALCVLKASLVWGIWLTVVGALALIGAAPVAFVWRNRAGGG